MQRVGQCVRSRGGVNSAVEQRAFRSSDQFQWSLHPIAGQKILGVPILDVSGHTTSAVKQVHANAVRHLIMHDRKIGWQGACPAQQAIERTQGAGCLQTDQRYQSSGQPE
jgi:hypothetical protein